MTDDIQNEIKKLQADLDSMTEAAKRAMADLQNFKRRSEEDRRQMGLYANLKLLEAIFPTIDNLNRAVESTPETLKDNEWAKGIASILTSLTLSLTTLGLKPIEEVGIPADPNIHEVLMEGEGPAGTVTQIFEKGYSFNGSTVRPAKVQVGKGE